MKSLFFGVLFTLSLVSGLNANIENKKAVNELIREQESCVSIAGELTADRPDLFALAYNYCIRQRCGCNQ